MVWCCEICGIRIHSKYDNFIRHIETHEPVAIHYKCLMCDQTCALKYNFKIHCLRKHGLETEEEIEKIISLGVVINEGKY